MTLQTRTGLQSTVTTNLPDNSTKSIDPSEHRAVENNLIDGIWQRVSASITDAQSPYSVDVDEVQVLLADPSSNPITVNLPAVASSTGAILTVKNIGTTNAVTLDGNASENIDGSTTYALPTQYNAVTVFCDGTTWHVLSTA